ncbi:MAG: V-type ATPase subunit [Lachnospiraceae bacterium]|jgi:V/A-type H+-transporting ATPase subunit C|nr:V-type ATPase subunit [Lachnospiraceae bacterium]
MPQENLFAVGRLKVLENRMLDQTRLNRLKEADAGEFLRILEEFGYGMGTDAHGNLENLIGAELEQARVEVAEGTPNKDLTDLFLLPTDAHNLKVLLKCRLMGSSPEGLLAGGGCFDTDVLAACVDAGRYDALPTDFAAILQKMEERLQRASDPLALSAAVDRAVFAHVQSVLENPRNRNACISEYFTAKIDFTNVRSIVRARRLHWKREKAEPLLIPGGEIPFADLLDALEAPDDALVKKLAKGTHSRRLTGALEEYMSTGSTKALEDRMDDILSAMVDDGRWEIFSISPIVGYLLRKDAEARAIRVLYAQKLSGKAAA